MYASYVPSMMKNAADVRPQWLTLDKGRETRIWTLPRRASVPYREAYIFEALVSFRHHVCRVRRESVPTAASGGRMRTTSMH